MSNNDYIRRAAQKEGWKKYYDIETEEIITEEDLEKEYNDLKKTGDTEAATFNDYLINCTSKNGTLEEIANV